MDTAATNTHVRSIQANGLCRPEPLLYQGFYSLRGAGFKRGDIAAMRRRGRKGTMGDVGLFAVNN